MQKRLRLQKLPADGKQGTALSVREPAEIADARKASRQYVLEKAAQELFVSQRYRTVLAVMSIVLPTKTHLVVVDREPPG